MTTFEHALLGVNGVLACGLHRRFGWKLVALGGVAAIMPDWDGLPMLIDMARFEAGHRVWGHNVLACFLLGGLLGSIDYWFDLSGHLAQRLVAMGPLQELAKHVDLRTHFSQRTWMVWMLVATLAALTQIPADIVVSGGKGLTDWALKPLWPFSAREFVYAMVPWGNVGVTVIFAIAMLLQIKLPDKTQQIAASALFLVALYIVLWATTFNSGHRSATQFSQRNNSPQRPRLIMLNSTPLY